LALDELSRTSQFDRYVGTFGHFTDMRSPKLAGET
jgi:hypothetical protein